jgi:hypothetical protein
MTNFGPGVQRLECGCSLIDGRCDIHGDMMRDIYQAWKHADSNAALEAIYSLSDGYGEQGYVPEQGYDWSGIRDSSPEAIKRMWKAVHA